VCVCVCVCVCVHVCVCVRRVCGSEEICISHDKRMYITCNILKASAGSSQAEATHQLNDEAFINKI
jgi:hypothetical protein